MIVSNFETILLGMVQDAGSQEKRTRFLDLLNSQEFAPR